MAMTNNPLAELVKMAAPGADPEAVNPAIEQLLAARSAERSAIDSYANEFRPVAGTEYGVQALEGLMANRNADNTQRAAAFEVINPGVQAGIGTNGEITLTAKPGSDLGFKYPVFSQQTTEQRALGAQSKGADVLGNFETQFRDIQNMTDPAEIANAYAAMQASSASLLESRRAALRGQIGGSKGLTQLEEQMQADKVADQAFYAQYYGGQDLGPTDESLVTIQQYTRLKGEVDAEVNERLQTDTALTTVDAQMKSLGMLVNSKLQKAFSGEGEETAAALSLVGPESIDAVFIARGIDPAAATATDRQVVASQLFSGQNNATRQSMELGMAPADQVAALAATGQGDLKQQAQRVLNQRTGNPEISKLLLDSYAAFDQVILPTLPKDVSDSLKAPAVATAKEKLAFEERARVIKMGMVIEKLKAEREKKFVGHAQSWDLPQSPELAEVEVIRKDLLAKDPNATVSMDSIIQRMDWNKPNPAKIEALSNYINSQAQRLPDNNFYGLPMLYANPEMSKRYVQALAVKARSSVVMQERGLIGLPGLF